MSKKAKTRSPALIARNFNAAIDRILAGKPRNKKLLNKAKHGICPVNFSTVAIEAGHSRTLIALKSTRFSGIRDRIRAFSLSNRGPADPSRKARLEEKNAELRKKLSYALSTALAALRKCRALEMKLDLQQRKSQRPHVADEIPY